MSVRKRRHKRKIAEYTDVELNIMPFIDIFSMLNTFLLFSAVFLSIGIIKVQVPFLSNTPPPKEKPKRTLSVKVDVARDKVELVTEYSLAPVDLQKKTYDLNSQGLSQLHQQLTRTRMANQETDLVTLFSDDDVKYENLIQVLDAVKLRKPNDPVFPVQPDEPIENKYFVYPKVVMGSVML